MKSLACFLMCIATTSVCNVALGQFNQHGVVFSFHKDLNVTELEDLIDYPEILQLFDDFSADSVTKAYPGAPPDKRVHKYFMVWVDSSRKYDLRDLLLEMHSAVIELAEATGDFYPLSIEPNNNGRKADGSVFHLKISPNPASGPLLVTLPENLSTAATLVLYNPLGQQVQRTPIVPGQAQRFLSVQGLSAGMYILALEGPAGVLARAKVVKGNVYGSQGL